MTPNSLLAAWMIDGGYQTDLRRSERDLAIRRALVRDDDSPTRPGMRDRLAAVAAAFRTPVPATSPAVDCCSAA